LLRKSTEESDTPILESETAVRPPWRLRSWQGLVIRAIAQNGRPLTWKEIKRATGLRKRPLNFALAKLIQSEDIFKIPCNNAESKYNIERTFSSLFKVL
jgi:hypothetical protein